MTNTMPERTATPAELCDEISRAERARTGQRRPPRTLHAICQQAAILLPCEHCGARPGSACSGRSAYHLARFVSAFVQGMLTVAEWPTVLGGLDVFTNATVIKDGQR